MTALQQSRYDQTMRRVGDLKGQGSKVADVLTELFPVVDVENVPGELLRLGGTLLGWGDSTGIAGVGDRASVGLFNPADSGKLVTVTSIWTFLLAVGSVSMGLYTTSLGGGVPGDVRDFRTTTLSKTSAQTEFSIADSITPVNVAFRVVADETFRMEDVNGLVVLSPGTGVKTVMNGTNGTINTAFLWRERIAEPSELNF